MDALAAQQWQEALCFCSDRVRAKAAEWPSPGVFFSNTVPIDLLLAQDFGYWSGSPNFYVLLVPLTVLDDQGHALPYSQTPAQTIVRKGQVAPGALVVLADRLDLSAHSRR